MHWIEISLTMLCLFRPASSSLPVGLLREISFRGQYTPAYGYVCRIFACKKRSENFKDDNIAGQEEPTG
jgi:hypothetical protein